MALEPLVDLGNKFLGTDNVAVCKVPRPVPEPVHAVEHQPF